jgi:hypothetical protein
MARKGVGDAVDVPASLKVTSLLLVFVYTFTRGYDE